MENSDAHQNVHTYIHEHASNWKCSPPPPGAESYNIVSGFCPRLVTVKVRLTLNFLCRALVSIGVGPSPVSRLLLLLLHLIVPPGLLYIKHRRGRVTRLHIHNVLCVLLYLAVRTLFNVFLTNVNSGVSLLGLPFSTQALQWQRSQ